MAEDGSASGGGGERGEFPAFPYTPYPIQIQFMTALYQAIQKGGVALLESPTGTGKTLSIICSALQWLVDHQHQQSHSNSIDHHPLLSSSSRTAKAVDDDDEPDWMRDFVPQSSRTSSTTPSTRRRHKLGVFRKTRRDAAQPRSSSSTPSTSGRAAAGNGSSSLITVVSAAGVEEEQFRKEDLEFLVDEHLSGEEEEEEEIAPTKRKVRRPFTLYSSTSGSSSDSSGSDEHNRDEVPTVQIYFCSRTHSQLSQFIKELKKTVFASQLKIVCLGSRQNMCINPEVVKLRNSNQINERCLELQKNKTVRNCKVHCDDGKSYKAKVSSKCPMLSKQRLQKQFQDQINELGALDIEDTVQIGRTVGTCPYYGSRNIAQSANLVVLPYQSLLMKSARETLGLNIKDSIIIVDEAHNLADSLTNMYNSKVTASQLEQICMCLRIYLKKFQELLGAANRRYIQILLVLVDKFLHVLVDEREKAIECVDSIEEDAQIVGEKEHSIRSMTLNGFLFSLDIDNINLVKLLSYIRESNIINKVSGYGVTAGRSQEGSTNVSTQVGDSKGLEGSILSSFQSTVNFLASLTNSNCDGRIIISRKAASSSEQNERFLKFIRLDGEKIFAEIIHQARAVVLTGGTLQPIEEIKARLFPQLPDEQFHFFSCDHIVRSGSILPIAVSCGPTGRTFEFSYQSRSNPDVVEELGRLMCNVVSVVPEGVVLFFPSFEYERLVFSAWKSSGMLERIQRRKHVFREPRDNLHVEQVLNQYKDTVMTGASGALLLAVVGGRMSEGINFSDGMGRCVVMVGLPYPSPGDVELIERIKHIDGLGKATDLREERDGSRDQHGFSILRTCSTSGREYYENLCMKAVNQSIGRAIRHINDYAAILLVDSRYISKGVVPSPTNTPARKLPGWIKNSLVSVTGNFGEVHKLLHDFFRNNKKRNMNVNIAGQNVMTV